MWAKTLTVFFLKAMKLLPDFISTPVACVLQRATAERGEAGSEDDAGVKQIRVGHHALVQARYGLIHHREYQPVSNIFGNGKVWISRLFVRLDRFAILPGINTPSGLSPESLLLDHLCELRRDLLIERRAKDFRDVQRDVNANGVQKLDWSHRHAEIFRGAIDVP